jgi:hypothetical protein
MHGRKEASMPLVSMISDFTMKIMRIGILCENYLLLCDGSFSSIIRGFNGVNTESHIVCHELQ